MNENNYDIITIIKILLKWKVFVVVNVVSVTLIALIISFIIPKTYRASSVLMPPISTSEMDIFSPISNSPFGAFFPQTTDETMGMIAILKSRSLMTNVIMKFNLIEYYELENIEETISAFTDDVNIDVEDEGTISVSVDVKTGWFHPKDEEENAKRQSSEITNYYIDQLDVLNKKFKTEEASFQRIFIEKRYNQNNADLKYAEETLKEFEKNNKLISFDDQTVAAVDAATGVKSKILVNEVKLDVLAKTVQSNHPDIEQIKKEISALKKQLTVMEYGSQSKIGETGNIFHSFSDIPELGTQLLRLKRELSIQNTLFTFLTQQYEEAKIQEARNTPTIQVLDIAVDPENKYKPFRALIVLFAFILSIIFSSSIAFSLDNRA